MNTITPLTLIQNLSENYEGTARARKDSPGGFAPWDDRQGFPTIRHKHINPEAVGERLNSKKIMDKNERSAKLESYDESKKGKTKNKRNQEKGDSIPYTTLDISQLPNFSAGGVVDRSCNSRFRRAYNANKKRLRNESEDYKSAEDQRGLMRAYERSQKYEEMRRKIKRRKFKPAYEGLVTKEYLYPRGSSSDSKARRTQIINFPLELIKEPPIEKIPSVKSVNSTYNSFFVKHKFKKAYDDLEEQEVEEPKEWKGLSELLELSKSLFSKAFRDHRNY